MKLLNYFLKILFLLITVTVVLGQESNELNKDTLSKNEVGKNKFSLGIGLLTTKQNGNLGNLSADFLKTFNDNMAIGIGLDVYGKINEAEGYPYSLNIYGLLNPYLTKKNKKKFAELYYGAGLEINFTYVRLLALIRIDFDITKRFSIGMSIKQPIFYNDQENFFTYHIFKLNFSINSFQ